MLFSIPLSRADASVSKRWSASWMEVFQQGERVMSRRRRMVSVLMVVVGDDDGDGDDDDADL
eukprot:2549435-Rhodomonas_salina.3